MTKKLLAIIGIHLVLILGVFYYYHNKTQNAEGVDISHPSASEAEKPEGFSMVVNILSNELDPINYDFYGNRELSFIYEPLVKFDDYFAIKPALASSWGMLSSTEWQFNLRKGVKFHNGTDFNADDVITSLERARSEENSIFRDFMLTIKSVEKLDDYTIKITTEKPSPNLLSELTGLYIIPAEQARDEKITSLIGTGPFILRTRNGIETKMDHFQDYWGDLSAYPEKLTITEKENKYARLGYLLSGLTDVLADVPPLFVPQIEANSSTKLIRTPGIKSIFLLFNPKTEFNQQINNRTALNLAIDRDKMLEVAGASSRLANQFAGSGIFGYNSEIEAPEYDLQQAKSLINSKENKIFILTLTDKNEILGQFLKDQFEQLAIRINLNVVSQDALFADMQEGKSDFYLIGWDFSKGSTDDFFRDFVASNSEFNLLGYQSEEADKYINLAANEIDEGKRLKALQEAMKIITKQDIIGIPLFTIDNLLAHRASDYQISVRYDGIIHF